MKNQGSRSDQHCKSYFAPLSNSTWAAFCLKYFPCVKVPTDIPVGGTDLACHGWNANIHHHLHSHIYLCTDDVVRMLARTWCPCSVTSSLWPWPWHLFQFCHYLYRRQRVQEVSGGSEWQLNKFSNLCMSETRQTQSRIPPISLQHSKQACSYFSCLNTLTQIYTKWEILWCFSFPHIRICEKQNNNRRVCFSL